MFRRRCSPRLLFLAKLRGRLCDSRGKMPKMSTADDARARLKAAMNRIDINGTATWLWSLFSKLIVFSFLYRRIGRQVPLYYRNEFVTVALTKSPTRTSIKVGKEIAQRKPRRSLCSSVQMHDSRIELLLLVRISVKCGTCREKNVRRKSSLR